MSKSRPSSNLPKPPITLHPTAVVAESAVITGIFPVEIGQDVVLSPRSKICSTYGPVLVGDGCIISEKAIVGLTEEPVDAADEDSDGTEVRLEKNVVLEAAAVVEGRLVREGALLGPHSKVGQGATVGKFCKITALCTVGKDEELPDYTVVYGYNQKRRERPGLEVLRIRAHEKQIEALRRLIPSNLAKWTT